jgi:uncharacterized protein (TIGR00297 family)
VSTLGDVPHRAIRLAAPSGTLVRFATVGFAFLLPFLTWPEAAGCALLALLFYAHILPQLEPGLAEVRAETNRGWMGRLGTPGALYAISLVALILIFRHQMGVVAAAWAILAVGGGMAGVAGVAWSGPMLPWNREKNWPSFAAFILAGTAGAMVLSRWVAPAIPINRTFYVCLATAAVGALAASAPIRLDNSITVTLGAGGFMFCALLIQRSALDSNLPYLGVRVILAVLVSAIFALAALALRLATRSGAAAGFVLSVAIYMGYGWKSFLVLFAFFVLGAVATRLGYAKKAARGIAQGRGGARSWREAGANLLAGAFFSILVITTHREAAFLAALVAALAEAAGDTVSSEIGEWLSDRAYLLTTLEAVPAGEDGGLSVPGTLAGVLASAAIAGLGGTLGLLKPGVAVGVLAAAMAGNLLDSLLGATLERRGLVTNGAVNLIGTCFAGALTLAFMLH